MTIGEYPALPPAKARSQAEDLYAKVRLGQHPASDKKKTRSDARHTFGRLVAGYLEHQRGELRDSSHAEVSRYLDRYASSLHGLPASAIDRKRIADLLDTIAREHGAISANRARAGLSALFGWAIRRGLHDNNPVIGTEQRKERTRNRVLSDLELAAIWNALGGSDFDNIIRLLILTGQRASEISGLRWNEINFDEGLIAYRQSEPRTDTRTHFQCRPQCGTFWAPKRERANLSSESAAPVLSVGTRPKNDSTNGLLTSLAHRFHIGLFTI